MTGIEPRNVQEQTAADALFLEFINRAGAGEGRAETEILSKVTNTGERAHLRQLLENYQHRARPRPASADGPGDSASRRLGQFELLGELGRGGMGAVFLAFDHSLKRRVALKVLLEAQARDEASVHRFVREAEAAARLHHPNIVQVYSAGESNDTYYYSMEYVPGITLAEVIRALRARGGSDEGGLVVRRLTEAGEPVVRLMSVDADAAADPLQEDSASRASERGARILSFRGRGYVREALRLFAGVADALEYSHDAGVVHRDVKPSNLILSVDGRLMLADFGLAKVGDELSITRTGDFMGTPSYLSPEQALGRRGPVDHRCDIWSLGVTLYEFLTLQHPFAASAIDLTLRNIIAREPVSPTVINPRLPRDVETIVLKMLEKDPAHRYASGAALAADLRSVLRNESIQARARGPITRSVRFVRRHAGRVTVTVLAAALLAVSLLAWSMIRDQGTVHAFDKLRAVSQLLRSQQNPLLDGAVVEAIEAEVGAEYGHDRDLRGAIDRAGVRATQQASAEIELALQGGPLEPAMRALIRVDAIYSYNQDEDRTARQRIADARVRFVWEIAARLAQPAAGGGVAPDRLWLWLCRFLGNGTLAVGPERDPFVQVNAMHAMACLGGEWSDRLVEQLGILPFADGIDSRVQRDAIQLLRERSGQRSSTLRRLVDLLAESRVWKPGVLVRHEIALALAGAPDPQVYRAELAVLASDPCARISAIATEALR